MRKSTLLISTLLFIGLGVSSGFDATACSCLQVPEEPIDTIVAKYDAVFLGRITRQYKRTVSVDKASGAYPEEHLFSEFVVRQAWKGITEALVTVSTEASGATCGYPFRVGQEYLVYATGQEMYVHLCGHTKPLAQAGRDIGGLGVPKFEFHDSGQRKPPNKRMNLPIQPVTARAGARSAPDWLAGYAQR